MQTSTIIYLFPSCFLCVTIPATRYQIIYIFHLALIPFNRNNVIDDASRILFAISTEMIVTLQDNLSQCLPLSGMIELVLFSLNCISVSSNMIVSPSCGTITMTLTILLPLGSIFFFMLNMFVTIIVRKHSVTMTAFVLTTSNSRHSITSIR